MQEDDATNRLIRQKLDTLREAAMDFGKSVLDCSIIMATHNSENIGEIQGSLNNGASIKDKTQRQEYDGSIDLYNKFKRHLLRCSCK